MTATFLRFGIKSIEINESVCSRRTHDVRVRERRFQCDAISSKQFSDKRNDLTILYRLTLTGGGGRVLTVVMISRSTKAEAL